MCLVPGRSFSQDLVEGEYLSRQHTSMVNGVFIWLVFLRHFGQYQPSFAGVDEWILLHECDFLGQLIVSTFFFFSGWGIMSSLQKKGQLYVKNLICVRFPGLLRKFVLAVLVFLGIQAMLGEYYPWERVMWSLIGWLSVGNSNWFIFMTLLMYLLVAGSCAVVSVNRPLTGVLLVCVLLAVVVFVVGEIKYSYWYDTLYCLPAGMMYQLLHRYIKRNWLKWLGLAAVVLIPAGWWFYHHVWELASVMPFHQFWFRGMWGNVGSVLFATGVALLAGSWSILFPSVSTAGRWLAWCGGPALFYIYIYQRIPMLLGQRFGLASWSGNIYWCVCVCATLLIALGAVRFSGRGGTR